MSVCIVRMYVRERARIFSFLSLSLSPLSTHNPMVHVIFLLRVSALVTKWERSGDSGGRGKEKGPQQFSKNKKRSPRDYNHMLVSPPPQASKNFGVVIVLMWESKKKIESLSPYLGKGKRGTIDVDDLSRVYFCVLYVGRPSPSLSKELVGSVWFFRVSMAISTVAARGGEKVWRLRRGGVCKDVYQCRFFSGEKKKELLVCASFLKHCPEWLPWRICFMH